MRDRVLMVVAAISMTCLAFVGQRVDIVEASAAAAETVQLRIPKPRVLGHVRLIAADTLEPVEGCRFETILIGPDGGDGGFWFSFSNEEGLAALCPYLGPGRYQIYIKPPADSRYRVTQYTKPGTYLIIDESGSSSPVEFKVDVKGTE